MNAAPASWPYWVRLLGSQRHLTAVAVGVSLWVMAEAAHAGREGIVAQMVTLISLLLGALAARRGAETINASRVAGAPQGDRP